ncbi:MAG: hypothetical protein HY730_03105 [Candidatus Tectomicrobia bacterium]|uniref:TPM domain-containing protein n=1 Tax=Tectimicrobiota bacterium TaxID=2528274 RepID=A0A933GKP5_UNCTE|nr:hypothetical protein [Candidatus Tectomicrobia bacterium]
MKKTIFNWFILMSVVSLWMNVAFAHVTPPVVLISDRDAISALTVGATRYYIREVKLTANDLDSIKEQWGWKLEELSYRFYLGRDDQDSLVSAVAFLTEYTIDGPVRIAVAIGSDGKVKGALIVELTRECYHWLKPLIDRNFIQDYVGQDSGGNFGLGKRLQKGHLGEMPRFYAKTVATLIKRGAVLFESALLKRGDKR